MYCSRCNGLLLEGFLQIVTYGKSLQQEGAGVHFPCSKPGSLKNQNNGGSSICNMVQDEMQDPTVHPWGGLTTTREGSLTLMDCYLYSKSLKGLQIVSAVHLYWVLMQSFSLFGSLTSFLVLGIWWSTCKGAGKRIALSWCLWWGRPWLDKPRNCELW